jgi:7-carboxy-7-deazaguanine synthase
MRIAEIYKSIQGEGFLTGTESVFIRTSGCNLRCWFCDTPYTSWQPEGEDLAVADILERAGTLGCSHAVVTGGEPMLNAELIPLCAQLRAAGHHATIETAGTLYLPVECDLMSISPKLANSAPALSHAPRWHARHESTREAPDVIRRLTDEYPYQLKFVVDSREDCDDVERYLERFPEIDRQYAMLMPQGVEIADLRNKAQWLEPLCRERGFHFCPRRHIEWFGLARGT